MTYAQDRIAEIRAELGLPLEAPRGRKSKRVKVKASRIKVSALPSPVAPMEEVAPSPAIKLGVFEEMAEQLRVEDQELSE
jgi:hypothetical protein